MKTVWKYEITFGQDDYEMPEGATIICAKEQGDRVCVWAVVDPNETNKETRSISVFGTGQPIPDIAMKHLGTAQLQAGRLVFHVFEIFNAA